MVKKLESTDVKLPPKLWNVAHKQVEDAGQ